MKINKVKQFLSQKEEYKVNYNLKKDQKEPELRHAEH